MTDHGLTVPTRVMNMIRYLERHLSQRLPVQLRLFEEHFRPSMRPSVTTLFGDLSRSASLQVCVLGSGSSGNSTVLRLGDRTTMIDAGFGPRTTARRMASLGVRVDDIDALCLTHLDRDHFNPNWIATLLDKNICVYIHSRHIQTLYRLDGARQLCRAGLLNVISGQPFQPMAGLDVRTIQLPHDRKGTTGFLLESQSGRIGYATDLGRVPDDMIRMFAGVDLLAIESNYDPVMQQSSDRPLSLKRRIMGGYGHLSNAQACQAVSRIFDHSPGGGPVHVLLLHRSRRCNCPRQVRRCFAQDRRLASSLILTEQSQPTGWLTVQGQTASIDRHGTPAGCS